MRKLGPRALFIALAFCTLGALHAQPLNAGDVFNGLQFYNSREFSAWCRSSDPGDQRACAAYVCGVLDAWSMQYTILHTRPFPYCLPAGTTCKRLSEVVMDYITKNPDRGQGAADGVVGYALFKLFPCLTSG